MHGPTCIFWDRPNTFPRSQLPLVDGDLRIMDGATAILQNVHMAHAVTVEHGGTLDARDSLVRRRSLRHHTGLS